MDYKTKVTIAKQSSADLIPRLYMQSVGFFTPKDDGLFLSSGTLVAIGDRLFICTASHCVPKSDDHVWVLSGEPTLSTAPHAPVVNKGFYPYDDPDVGFLELGTNAATEFLKKEACPLTHLAIRGIGRPLRSTILIGNPGEYVKQTELDGRPAFVPQMISYYTVPWLESEWPQGVNADPSQDIFLDYPKTPGQRMDNDEPVVLPHPEGMSGGGLWDQGFESGEIWTHDSVRLIGVQSRWHPGLRYVRSIQIIHWLRLIHERYTDLRPILEAQFSELAPS